MSKVSITERWENFVPREEVEEILTVDLLEDIETMEDLKETLEQELQQLVEMIKFEDAVRKEQKKQKNLLTHIYFFKKYLLIIKLCGYFENDKETIDKIITILSDIEKENNCEDENIGTRINDKNHEKYINCRNQLIEIENLLNKENSDILEIIDEGREICDIKGLIFQIKDSIKKYKKDVDKNKKK